MTCSVEVANRKRNTTSPVRRKEQERAAEGKVSDSVLAGTALPAAWPCGGPGSVLWKRLSAQGRQKLAVLSVGQEPQIRIAGVVERQAGRGHVRRLAGS